MTTRKDTKEGKKKHGNNMLGWKDQNKIADDSDNTTWTNKSKDISERKET